jgi:hypothetical protein
MQSGHEEYLWDMSIPWTIPCLLVLKEKNYVALSTAEAEYVTAGSCCAQLH